MKLTGARPLLQALLRSVPAPLSGLAALALPLLPLRSTSPQAPCTWDKIPFAAPGQRAGPQANLPKLVKPRSKAGAAKSNAPAKAAAKAKPAIKKKKKAGNLAEAAAAAERVAPSGVCEAIDVDAEDVLPLSLEDVVLHERKRPAPIPVVPQALKPPPPAQGAACCAESAEALGHVRPANAGGEFLPGEQRANLAHVPHMHDAPLPGLYGPSDGAVIFSADFSRSTAQQQPPSFYSKQSADAPCPPPAADGHGLEADENFEDKLLAHLSLDNVPLHERRPCSSPLAPLHSNINAWDEPLPLSLDSVPLGSRMASVEKKQKPQATSKSGNAAVRSNKGPKRPQALVAANAHSAGAPGHRKVPLQQMQGYSEAKDSGLPGHPFTGHGPSAHFNDDEDDDFQQAPRQIAKHQQPKPQRHTQTPAFTAGGGRAAGAMQPLTCQGPEPYLSAGVPGPSAFAGPQDTAQGFIYTPESEIDVPLSVRRQKLSGNRRSVSDAKDPAASQAPSVNRPAAQPAPLMVRSHPAATPPATLPGHASSPLASRNAGSSLPVTHGGHPSEVWHGFHPVAASRPLMPTPPAAPRDSWMPSRSDHDASGWVNQRACEAGTNTCHTASHNPLQHPPAASPPHSMAAAAGPNAQTVRVAQPKRLLESPRSQCVPSSDAAAAPPSPDFLYPEDLTCVGTEQPSATLGSASWGMLPHRMGSDVGTGRSANMQQDSGLHAPWGASAPGGFHVPPAVSPQQRMPPNKPWEMAPPGSSELAMPGMHRPSTITKCSPSAAAPALAGYQPSGSAGQPASGTASLGPSRPAEAGTGQAVRPGDQFAAAFVPASKLLHSSSAPGSLPPAEARGQGRSSSATPPAFNSSAGGNGSPAWQRPAAGLPVGTLDAAASPATGVGCHSLPASRPQSGGCAGKQQHINCGNTNSQAAAVPAPSPPLPPKFDGSQSYTPLPAAAPLEARHSLYPSSATPSTNLGPGMPHSASNRRGSQRPTAQTSPSTIDATENQHPSHPSFPGVAGPTPDSAENLHIKRLSGFRLRVLDTPATDSPSQEPIKRCTKAGKRPLAVIDDETPETAPLAAAKAHKSRKTHVLLDSSPDNDDDDFLLGKAKQQFRGAASRIQQAAPLRKKKKQVPFDFCLLT